MPINKTQMTLLEGTYQLYLEIITECSPDIAERALISIFDNETYSKPLNKKEFQDYDILSSIDFFRKILIHPSPQNRSTSYPYVEQSPGKVNFAIREGDIKERDAKNEEIILHNGTRIPKENLICDKIKYAENEAIPGNTLSVIAWETEGLLSLTSHGPISKEEITEHLRQMCIEAQKKIKENNKEHFKKIETITQGLTNGLTVIEDIKSIETALEQFKNLDNESKKAVTYKIKSIFPEQFSQLDHKDYDNNAFEKMIISKVTANLKLYESEEEELKKSEDKVLFEQIDTKMSELKDKNDNLKKEAFDKCWKELNLKNSKHITTLIKESQWISLKTSARNYQTIQKSFAPNQNILTLITKYKENENMIYELQIKRSSLKQAGSLVTFTRKERNTKEQIRLKSQEWLRHLRHGNFEEAENILKVYKDKKLNMHITDEYGRNSVYYALTHHNYLLAYFLIKDHNIETQHSLSEIIPQERTDVLLALKNKNWLEVGKTEIQSDINKLLSGESTQSLDQLRTKYVNTGWTTSVYANGQLINVFDDVAKNTLSLLKYFYEAYLEGKYWMSSHEQFHILFNRINKPDQYWNIRNDKLTFYNTQLHYALENETDATKFRDHFIRLNALSAYDLKIAMHSQQKQINEAKSDKPQIEPPVMPTQDAKQTIPDHKTFTLPPSLKAAIEKEITRFQTSSHYMSFGMTRKYFRINAAYGRAISKLNDFQDIESFMNFKETKNGEQLPSIKEALNNPRKWPGCEPLYGVTQSWENVRTVMERLDPSLKLKSGQSALLSE